MVAKATHWGLYALVVATLWLGLVFWWVRGDTWFFVFSPPAYNPANAAVRSFVGEWHETLGTAILWLAGLHAAAALVHRYVWRDGVLARMVSRATR